MKKYIKLFEEFNTEPSLEEVANSIYEKWKSSIDESFFHSFLNENEHNLLLENDDTFWDEDDRELTKGEKAAMSRDFQIISREQLAALYLRGLGASEGDPGKYLVMIPGIEAFGRIDDLGAFIITAPALADAIGLESYTTVSRTVKKFVNLIGGVGETASEAIYPKIIEAYEYFRSKDPKFIANMIEVNNPTEYTLNRDKAAEGSVRAKNLEKERKARNEQLGEKVYSLVNALRKESAFKDIKKSLHYALNRISQETSIEPEKLKEIYRKFLISRNLLSSVNFA